MKNYSKIFLTAIMILTALASVKAVAPANDNFLSAQNLGSGLTGSVTGTNAEATQETDEPNHYTTNPNKQSVWYKWTAPANRSMTFELVDGNFSGAFAIYTAPVAFPAFWQLTKVQSNADLNGYNYTGSRINFWATTGTTYYIAVEFSNAGGPGSQTGNFELKVYPKRLAYSTKFDARNQRASLSIFRPSNGMWYYLWNMFGGSYETIYGKNGDTPMPADYDGDGRTDIAVVRDENGSKVWYASFISTIIWGLPGDKALVGDFDNDGKADLTAVRSNGVNLVWYARRSKDGGMTQFKWGLPTDKPFVGDFDGDGISDAVVTRNTPDGLFWYILRSNGGGFGQYTTLQFGLDSDVIATEDYDGDGKTDIAVFRPSNGTWYILRSTTNEVQATPFGSFGDRPQPADYDGDGKSELAVFRPSDGNWYLWLSGSDTQKIVHWGVETDIPTTSMNTLAQ